MGRTEDGRRGHNDHIHPGVDDFLISVKAREAMILRDFLSMFLGDGLAGGLDPVGEHVAKGGDGDAVRRGEEIAHGTGAAAAAADETGLEGTAVDGLVRQFGNVVGTGFPERGDLGFLFPAGAGGEELSAHQTGRADDGGGREEGPSVHL